MDESRGAERGTEKVHQSGESDSANGSQETPGLKIGVRWRSEKAVRRRQFTFKKGAKKKKVRLLYR